MTKAVSFLLIFGVLFQTATQVLVSTRPGTKARQVGFYQQENQMDVLFVGSSSIYTFISPGVVYDEAGFSSYNYAVPGMDVDQIKYALVECMKTQSPKLYVIDIRTAVTYEEYNESDVRRLIDNMPMSMNRINAIKNLVEDDNKLPFYFSIIKYHDRWEQLTDVDFMGVTGDVDEDLGFETYPKSKVIDVDEKYLNYDDTKIKIAKKNEKALRDLITFCQKNKLNVLFVSGVWKPNKNRNGKLNYIKSIVEEYNMPFLNTNEYYDEIGIDWSTDMNNISHVNILGAKKYSVFMANYLKKNYTLPDRRNDAAYADWDVASERFEEQYKEVADKIL